MKILLIEDNPGDADLVCKTLARTGRPYEVLCAARLSQGLERIEAEAFDAVLSDLSLPDSFGLQAVTTLSRRAPRLPLVVLTSLSDDRTALRALDEGAQDYLNKDQLNEHLLERSIRYAIHRKKIAAENLILLGRVQ